jgi:hypothetical protein
MVNEIKINDKGLEKYPMSTVIFGNIMMLLIMIVGTVAVWYLLDWWAWLYLAISFIMVYIFMRRIVCRNCYYYDKWCALGWGKLSAKLIKKGNLEDFAKSSGLKIAPAVYSLMMFVPIIAIIISIILVFDYTKVGILVLLILFSVYSAGIGRKSACSKCKMNISCPGSAVKT